MDIERLKLLRDNYNAGVWCTLGDLEILIDAILADNGTPGEHGDIVPTITHPCDIGPQCDHDWEQLSDNDITGPSGRRCRKCGQTETWTSGGATYDIDPRDRGVNPAEAEPLPDVVAALRSVAESPHTIINATNYTTAEARCLAAAAQELSWALVHKIDTHADWRRWDDALTTAEAVVEWVGESKGGKR